MAQSLFKACKEIYRSGTSGTENVGGYDIGFELYKQSDIDANVAAIDRGEASGCTFGDSDQSKVVLVMDNTITIPSGFNLTPVSPKKSLIICCNTFINNGTVSMYAKGPNVEPHDWFILGKSDNYGENNDIIIPAYANNAVPATSRSRSNKGGVAGIDGVNGTDRNCGSGGTGAQFGLFSLSGKTGASGSGYAFGGGAGSGGIGYKDNSGNGINVDTTYPMRGSKATHFSCYDSVFSGGVGNPSGAPNYTNVTKYTAPTDVGVGGRIIIYCVSFENNGTISANGVSNTWTCNKSTANIGNGGASGAGAIDIFYTDDTTLVEGTVTATGGSQISYSTSSVFTKGGIGGNGSITLLQWDIQKVVRPEKKYMSRANMIYFLQELVNKINEG